MTQQLEYTFNNSSSTPESRFDEWWDEEHQDDEDVDDIVEDDYSEEDFE